MKKTVFSVIFAVIFCFSAVITASAHWIPDYFNEPEVGEHHEAIGSMLALKMDAMKEDPEYKFAVGISFNETAAEKYYTNPSTGAKMTFERFFKCVNDMYDAKIDISKFVKLIPLDDINKVLTHYAYLTADQIDKILRYMDSNRSQPGGDLPLVIRMFYIGSGYYYYEDRFDTTYTGKSYDTFPGTPVQWADYHGDGMIFYYDMVKQLYPIDNDRGLYKCEPYIEETVSEEKSILPEPSVILAAAAVFFSLIAALFSILSYKKAAKLLNKDKND